MAHKYYLGIDGGGTKTSYLVIDENKKIVKEITSLGTAIDTYPIDLVKKRLLKNINSFKYKFSGIYAGIGGITSKKDIELIKHIIASSKNCIGKVNANNDVTNALEGALNGDGIILIAGTGAVVYGKNKRTTHRAGGYGYKEGDAGSSYYLGYRALQHLARVVDNRLPLTPFSKELIKDTKCSDFSNLAKFINKADRSYIASLAVIVTKHAKSNKYAAEIINDAIDEVLTMIYTVYRECGFKKTNFSIIGGLGNANSLYKELLLKGLNNNIVYIKKKHEASYGASLLAYKLINK